MLPAVCSRVERRTSPSLPIADSRSAHLLPCASAMSAVCAPPTFASKAAPPSFAERACVNCFLSTFEGSVRKRKRRCARSEGRPPTLRPRACSSFLIRSALIPASTSSPLANFEMSTSPSPSAAGAAAGAPTPPSFDCQRPTSPSAHNRSTSAFATAISNSTSASGCVRFTKSTKYSRSLKRYLWYPAVRATAIGTSSGARAILTRKV
mmetsp:Transcript_20350/g.51719  ORF Transcript_20350/g.51719 Transcript_20350/m.51719 type:complete len:208 (-) Transcript_20350:559-1182(-)